ncbi:MAG: tetratricopeptide (TPR) repeat protein [Alphaproteobacteria bacterium]|jgi:tetratricopeptide (TPR) repeat protein
MTAFMSAQSQDSGVSETPANEAAKSLTEAQSASVSSSTLLAQSLLAQSDLYQASKRQLSASTKTKVVNALSQFNRGEFEKSEQIIKQILASEVDLNSGVFVLAGDIALANNKRNEAMVNYKQALSSNDHNAKAANRLGMHLREQGKFREAEKLYTQAINAQPSMPNGYRNRAVLYDLYLNDKAKALQDYEAYSALLNYQLALQDNGALSDATLAIADPAAAVSVTTLSEPQLKALRTDIKIAKRWLIDVGRQVDVIARLQSDTPASGQ